jgi:predicted metal-dependent hydrolase
MNHRQPDEFWQGVEQFNQHQFYACHDTLEALWMEATEPDKQFYQGILQIAVALYHLESQNWRGAVILLGEGINRLRVYQPDYGGINVENLLDESAQMLKILHETGPEQVATIVQQVDYWRNGTENLGEAELGAIALPTLKKSST